MRTLREHIDEAVSIGKAICHFNFATAEMLRGIVEGAKEAGKPVAVGLSEGERSFFGVREARAIVSALQEDFDIPIFLNADHTKSFEKVKEAIDAGFDSVVVDGSSLSFVENLSLLKQAIEYRNKVKKDVVIEGELGFIGTSSEVLEKMPPGVPLLESMMTKPEEAKRLIEESGADLLAPAVGNVHGIIREGSPHLSITRIKEIYDACGVPLVLHGASGTADADVSEAVKNGAAVVHYSTDLRVGFRKALSSALAENSEELAPYKYMRDSIKSVKDIVYRKMVLLS